MEHFKTIEEARAYFSDDRFATDNGITLDELDGEHAVTSLTLEARHRNAFGGVMGGAIFTLADFAEGRPQFVRGERRRRGRHGARHRPVRRHRF